MKRIGRKEKNHVYYKRKASYVIIEHDLDSKIAIATDEVNVYFFFGGGLEKDETPLEAVKREVLEETGFSLKDVHYFDSVTSWCYNPKMGFLDVEATFYTAKFDEKVCKPIELDHNILWVEPDEYKNKLFHEYQNYILKKFCNLRQNQRLNKLTLSTTIRCLGDKNNLVNFNKGLQIVDQSNFTHANLNFCEVQNLLDRDDYFEQFAPLVNKFNLVYNVAHAPIHYPFFFNDYFSNELRPILEKRILRSIELSKLFKVKYIVLHIGSCLDKNGKYDLQQSVKENIKYLSKFVSCAMENGIKIAIENGTNMANEVTPSIDELIEIVNYFNKKYNSDVLCVCFDTGHANVGKIDVYQSVKKLGKNLQVTHLHDNYGIDDHNFPLEGCFDWKSFYKGLGEIKFNGELTSEVRYHGLFDKKMVNKTYSLIKKTLPKSKK